MALITPPTIVMPNMTHARPSPELRAFSSTKVLMMPHEARRILVEERYELQRPLVESNIQRIQHLLRTHQFRRYTPITFAFCAGQRRLINGQHTLTALVRNDEPYFLTEEEYTVEHYDEIATLYDTFDRGYRRTMAQIYTAYDIAHQENLLEDHVKRLGQAMTPLATGFEALAPKGMLKVYVDDHHLKMQFIHEWQREFRAFYDAIPKSDIWHRLRVQAVLAVALVTFRWQPIVAAPFWKAVATDDGLAANDPRKRLHTYLQVNPSRNSTFPLYARFVASAWNAACERRTPNSLIPKHPHRPIKLAGTPYSGEHILRLIAPTGALLAEPTPYDDAAWQQDLFEAPSA